jgi:DNA topoisomerase-2
VDLTADGKAAIEKEGIEKVFKTQTQLSSSNMVCFDSQGKIKKYNTPEDILQEFYDIRLTYYQKRKVRSVECFALKM